MQRTIITVYGRANEGKTSTIRKIVGLLRAKFPKATLSSEPNPQEELLLTIDIPYLQGAKNVRIGIESAGDPNGRMVNEDTLGAFARPKTEDNLLGGCDIIICTTRTRGETMHLVQRISNEHDYHLLWTSSNFSPTLDQGLLNRKAAESIIGVIEVLIPIQF
jgi:hypothetical protein